MNFRNNGSDHDLVKSLYKQGLVQKDVTVQGKHGSYVRKQWVSPEVQGGKLHQAKPQRDNYKTSKTIYFPKADSGKSSTRVFKYSDILEYYGKHKEIRMPLQDFIKTNYFVSDGKSPTQSLYKTQRGYTGDRQKLHNKIIKPIVDNASTAKGRKPVAVLLGGGSASGKGTLRDTLVVPELQAKGISVGISDSDALKEQLPEYTHFKQQDPSTAASRVHDESMDISMQAVDELMKHNKDLLFDSTMKDPVKMSKMIDKLHRAGYEVQIVGVDVPIDVAIERSNNRANLTGRKVPKGIIQGSHGGFATTYPQLLDKVDKYALYDNSNQQPILVQDEKQVYKPDIYNKFLQKGKDHRTFKELRNLSKEYDVSLNNLVELHNSGASLEELKDYLELRIYEE